MGVSLQVYRSRIGTFQSRTVISSSKSTSTNQSDSLHLGKCVTLVVLLSTLLTLQLSITQLDLNPGYPHSSQLFQQFRSDDRVLFSKLLDTPNRLSSKDRNLYAKMVNGNRGGLGVQESNYYIGTRGHLTCRISTMI